MCLPQLKKLQPLFVFISVLGKSVFSLFFQRGYIRREDFSFFWFCDQNTNSSSFTFLEREETTEEDMNLFSSFTHLFSSPVFLPDWLLR